jgi:hypothetical protein
MDPACIEEDGNQGDLQHSCGKSKLIPVSGSIPQDSEKQRKLLRILNLEQRFELPITVLGK